MSNHICLQCGCVANWGPGQITHGVILSNLGNHKNARCCAPYCSYSDLSPTRMGDVEPTMSAGKEEDGVRNAKRMSTKATTMATPAVSEVKPGGQGRVKDPSRDKRLARNRVGPTGQGRVKDKASDRRLAANRPGPTGQGRVKNPK